MITTVLSVGLQGIDGFLVQVESDTAKGLPSFDIVGLPDAAVKESKERVRSAFSNCGFPFPIKRITLNLAPGGIRKEGPVYDLPICMALLAQAEIIDPQVFERAAFLGELSLSGELRRIRGGLPMALTAYEKGIKTLYVPAENAAECAVVSGLTVYPVTHIKELVAHLTGEKKLKPAVFLRSAPAVGGAVLDFKDVRGQKAAKRAFEVAAAGGHNILLIGSPGAGKSMMAARLPSILPPLSFPQSVETTKIHSVAGILPPDTPLVERPPFRAPHHTASPVGLCGGGPHKNPGEISLAHNGVLFLDELPEFSKSTLEILRQPIEEGFATITRASGTVSYPCRFLLVCAMNPCRCGYYGHPRKACTCTPSEISSYLKKISGPLLDRIDMHIEVGPVPFDDLSGDAPEEPSAEILKRVLAARERQRLRYGGDLLNARLNSAQLREYCPLSPECQQTLEIAFNRLSLSARAYDRIVKVARTIADLGGSADIERAHVLEALQYRSLDRKYFSRG